MNHTLFFKINPSIKFPAWDSDSHYKFLFSKNLFKTKRSYERWLEKISIFPENLNIESFLNTHAGHINKLIYEESIKKLVSNLQELEGKLDVLVNNAALGSFIHAFEKFPADEWDQMMNANVRGPFLLVKESLGLLATAANSDVHASVVNIVSVDGIRVAMDNDWAYGAGKAALIQLTRQWAATQGKNHGKEGGRNITFNAIAPGPFPGMLDHYLETEEGRAAVGAVTVSGRVGDPVDIGAACVYLSSRAGSYVTGSTIPVDGGPVSYTHLTLPTNREV